MDGSKASGKRHEPNPIYYCNNRRKIVPLGAKVLPYTTGYYFYSADLDWPLMTQRVRLALVCAKSETFYPPFHVFTRQKGEGEGDLEARSRNAASRKHVLLLHRAVRRRCLHRCSTVCLLLRRMPRRYFTTILARWHARPIFMQHGWITRLDEREREARFISRVNFIR